MWTTFSILLVALGAASAANLALPLNALNPLYGNRIVGGQAYDIRSVPYQISLQVGGSHICGGSILTRKFVLTAAHCIIGQEPNWKYFNVRVGSSLNNQGGQVLTVSRFFWHANYDPSQNWINDIAVLELSQQIAFGPGAQPVGLPRPGAPLPINSMATASGWGRLTEGGVSPTQLQGVQIPINDPTVCERAYGSRAFNRNVMVCAASVAGGHSTCQGDSGGPLVANGVQWGIVSWANGCAKPNYPTVFAHVSNLRQFITQVVGI